MVALTGGKVDPPARVGTRWDDLTAADLDAMSAALAHELRSPLVRISGALELVIGVEPTDVIRIEVHNQGHGVAPEDAERIFARWQRASDGTGLGPVPLPSHRARPRRRPTAPARRDRGLDLRARVTPTPPGLRPPIVSVWWWTGFTE